MPTFTEWTYVYSSYPLSIVSASRAFLSWRMRSLISEITCFAFSLDGILPIRNSDMISKMTLIDRS